jgi:hypothetical protein
MSCPTTDWRDLIEPYEQAISDDTVNIDTRMHWTEDDLEHLEVCARQDVTTLQEWWEIAAPVGSGRRLVLL